MSLGVIPYTSDETVTPFLEESQFRHMMYWKFLALNADAVFEVLKLRVDASDEDKACLDHFQLTHSQEPFPSSSNTQRTSLASGGDVIFPEYPELCMKDSIARL